MLVLGYERDLAMGSVISVILPDIIILFLHNTWHPTISLGAHEMEKRWNIPWFINSRSFDTLLSNELTIYFF